LVIAQNGSIQWSLNWPILVTWKPGANIQTLNKKKLASARRGGKKKRFFDASQLSLDRFRLDADKLMLTNLPSFLV
jgi:hypothetical protein